MRWAGGAGCPTESSAAAGGRRHGSFCYPGQIPARWTEQLICQGGEDHRSRQTCMGEDADRAGHGSD